MHCSLPKCRSVSSSTSFLSPRFHRSLRLTLGAFTLLGLLPASADVKMPLIFGDHMVLQQEIKLPVWGWAAPGEKVTVTLGTASASATAGSDGNWRVDLPPVPAGTPAQTLTVAGKNTITFQDVLIGDVWIASGQSNMEFGIGVDSRGAAAIAAANEPTIRLFFVPKNMALDPLKDLKPGAPTPAAAPGQPAPPQNLEGKWQVCSPETLGGHWGWSGFSATGYYFAHEISQKTGHPVGMIGTYWGGTPAQAWTSVTGLQKDPVLAHFLAERQKVVDNYEKAKADYPELKKKFDADMAAWNKDVSPAFQQATADWKKAAAAAVAAGQPMPPAPKPSVPKPKTVNPPEGGQNSPANLYNAMIAPLVPYAIKGAIWYQGESNAGAAAEYGTLFPRMISDWREKWAQGDFPFLFVQLADYMAPQRAPSEGGWAALRESQLHTLSLPNTGMAVAIDIGDPLDIHPKDKLDVGHRLALAARHIAYGESLVYSGPIYKSMSVEGNKIRLTFDDVGSGLTIGVPPWTPTGKPPTLEKELKGFAIAGADQKFVWGTAAIDGNSIVVSSKEVATPVAVRYDWANTPPGNLYNKEGLPASPFRTDDWNLNPPPPPAPAAPATSPAPAH